jgi:hypothetical protein
MRVRVRRGKNRLGRGPRGMDASKPTVRLIGLGKQIPRFARDDKFGKLEKEERPRPGRGELQLFQALGGFVEFD